jgi:hypothetical protein
MRDDTESLERVRVKALRAGSPCECVIAHEYIAADESYSMTAEIEGVPVGRRSARDAFACLCGIRNFLRKHDTILLVNGARVDAYPSRMSRDMGGGYQVCVTTMGQQGRLEDLVYLLDEAPPEKIGTVEDQKEFHRQWLRSLGRDI